MTIKINISIELKTGNDAFATAGKEVEVERIMREVAAKVDFSRKDLGLDERTTLRDYNGQPVGFLHLECNYEEDFPKEWEDEDDWDEEDDSEE